MKLTDLIPFALYAAGIGFCAGVGRTAWRVDAMSVVVALAALVLLFVWLIVRRWRAVMLRHRAGKRRVRMYSNRAWPDTH